MPGCRSRRRWTEGVCEECGGGEGGEWEVDCVGCAGGELRGGVGERARKVEIQGSVWEVAAGGRSICARWKVEEG